MPLINPSSNTIAANSNQRVVLLSLSSNDPDREAAFSMALNAAATLVQVIYQRQGGGVNLVSIFAIVLSLFAFLAYKYLSRAASLSASLSPAALSCNSLALFSSSLAVASLLAMPLQGILKWIPYAVCFFPLISLLSALLGNQCRRHNDHHNPYPCLCGWWFHTSRSVQDEQEEGEADGDEEGGSPPRFSNLPASTTACISNQQASRNAAAGGVGVEMVLPPTTTVVDVVAAVAAAAAVNEDREESAAADELKKAMSSDTMTVSSLDTISASAQIISLHACMHTVVLHAQTYFSLTPVFSFI